MSERKWKIDTSNERFICSNLIQWSCKGTGFGELSIGMRNGKLTIDSEGLSKESAKEILCALVDQAQERSHE